jgi:hypothetical protein
LASDWFSLLDIDLPFTSSERNHLDQYLGELLEPGITEPLKWWLEQRHIWLELGRMALDYHSVPGEYMSYHLFIANSDLQQRQQQLNVSFLVAAISSHSLITVSPAIQSASSCVLAAGVRRTSCEIWTLLL